MRIRVPFNYHRKQRSFLRIVRRLIKSGKLGPHVLAYLGGWGAGKTVVGTAGFGMIAAGALKGTVDGYRPQTVVLAPTARVLEKVLMPKLGDVIPPELIIKKTGRPYPTWHLVNGVDISFVSFEATFEGEDIAAMLVDEVQLLAQDPVKFQNYLARLRDPRASFLGMICTGLPEAGWVRDQFDPNRLNAKDRALRHTVLTGTRDNKSLPPDTVAQFLASCPAGYEAAFIEGGWMPMADALYDMFGEHNIVPSSMWDRSVPVKLGLDAGVSSAIVVGQHMSFPWGRGVLLGESVVGRHISIKELCLKAKEKYGKQIIAGHSKICCDPTIRSDELAAMRSVFPGVHIMQRKRTDKLYQVEPGIRLVQAAIQNSQQQNHVAIVASDRGTKRGLIDAWTRIKKSPRTGARIKDDALDHVDDAARYLLNHMLGDSGFAPQFSEE